LGLFGDEIMPTLDSLDERLRTVENAIIEIATISKYSRVLLTILALSLGVDITGFGV